MAPPSGRSSFFFTGGPPPELFATNYSTKPEQGRKDLDCWRKSANVSMAQREAKKLGNLSVIKTSA
jgi:hypothetical protein